MNKNIINLRIFIQCIFGISVILGFTLYFFVVREQDIETSTQLKKLIEGLEKNYIINVRPVDNQTKCNQNETAISTLLQGDQKNTYNLDYIEIGEENSKQIIGLCYELNYNYTFIRLKQQNELIKQEQKDCVYKGISFRSIEETGKCPISDIKFSTEESIPNYEKILLPNSNKLNLFLKRSDKNEVPLIGIHLSDENLEDKQITQIENTSFSMDDICKKYYNKFQKACSIESKPKQMKFNLFKEKPFAVDSDSSPQLLNYDTEKLVQEYNKTTIPISLSCFVLIFSHMVMVFFYNQTGILLSELDCKYDKSDIDYYVSLVVCLIGQVLSLYFLFLIPYSLYYYKQQKFSYVIQFLGGISYFNEDILKNIYEKAQDMNQLLIIIIWTQLIIILIDILIGLLSKSNKVPKHVRLENDFDEINKID